MQFPQTKVYFIVNGNVCLSYAVELMHIPCNIEIFLGQGTRIVAPVEDPTKRLVDIDLI